MALHHVLKSYVPLQQGSGSLRLMKSFISVSAEPGCLVFDPLHLYKSHLATLTCHYGYWSS